MTSPLEDIRRSFSLLKLRYDQGDNALEALGAVSGRALELLLALGTSTAKQGKAVLNGRTKLYEIRQREHFLSRPIRRDLFIAKPSDFLAAWKELLTAINVHKKKIDHTNIDGILYTAVMSFAVAFDLYLPTSRKTPGTFFEVMIGTLLAATTGFPRAKQITLPDSRYKVPTDIVLQGEKGKPSLVIPTKITTRERVVQPWAHQRILDDAFGRGKYKSVLVVVSELQRDGSKGVNEICVPGQIGLFQKYLAQMYGMYYLDPPASYMRRECTELLSTKPLSELFQADLLELLEL